VELIVGALVVLGFLAVVTRFITRDASGEIRLPRIVDDSIGMWALRRITGRRLWERPRDDRAPGDLPLDSNASDATRAALGAIAAANAANPSIGTARAAPIASRRVSSTIGVSPTPVHDLRRRQLAHARKTGRPTPVVPVVVRGGRRRDQARRKRILGWAPRFAAMGFLAAVLAVAIIALGVVVLPRGPQGEVLDSTGRPRLTPQSSQIAVVANSFALSPSVKLPTPTKNPTAAILSIQKSTIPGRSGLRVYVTWAISESGSGLKSQLFQRRTDSGSWVTVSLGSLTTRSVSLALARGHTYTFRVRGTDRAGNVGAFTSRVIRI
jgi:hypothetical protein